jgi:hypothetical protein
MGCRSGAVVAAGVKGLKALGLVSRNQGLDVKSCNPVRLWPLRGLNDARRGHGDQPDGCFNVGEQPLAVNRTGRTPWSWDPCFDGSFGPLWRPYRRTWIARMGVAGYQPSINRNEGELLRLLTLVQESGGRLQFTT